MPIRHRQPPGIAPTLALAVTTGLLLGPGRVLAESVTMGADALAQRQVDRQLQSMGGRAPELSTSWAEGDLALTVNVIVNRYEISVDGISEPVPLVLTDDGLIIPAEELRGLLVTNLSEALKDARERHHMRQLLWSGTATPATELLITLDASLPFSVTRPVLYTAGQEQFSDFQFVVHNPWLDRYTTIPSSLPSIGAPRPSSGEQPEKPPLSLTLALTDTGLTVFGADGATTVPCKSGGTCTGLDDYDWVELSRSLGLIKDAYPDHTSIIVVPDNAMASEVIVRAIDVARWSPIPEEDTAAHAAWQSSRRTMFDKPVMTGGAP